MNEDELFDESKFNSDEPILNLSNIVRWYLYDLEVVDANEIAKRLGLSPISAEVEEKEIEHSDERMSELIELLPFIDAMADVNARVLVSVQRDKSQEMVDKSKGGLNLEILEQNLTDSFRQISFSALVAAFSTGLELGMISQGTKNFSLEGDEEEDDDEQ